MKFEFISKCLWDGCSAKGKITVLKTDMAGPSTVAIPGRAICNTCGNECLIEKRDITINKPALGGK